MRENRMGFDLVLIIIVVDCGLHVFTSVLRYYQWKEAHKLVIVEMEKSKLYKKLRKLEMKKQKLGEKNIRWLQKHGYEWDDVAQAWVKNPRWKRVIKKLKKAIRK